MNQGRALGVETHGARLLIRVVGERGRLAGVERDDRVGQRGGSLSARPSSWVRRAIKLARSRGAEWLHVDYEGRLAAFYGKCGFRATEPGLVNLKEQRTARAGH